MRQLRLDAAFEWLRNAVGGEDKCRKQDASSACALALLRTALLSLVVASGRRSPEAAREELAHKTAFSVKNEFPF